MNDDAQGDFGLIQDIVSDWIGGGAILSESLRTGRLEDRKSTAEELLSQSRKLCRREWDTHRRLTAERLSALSEEYERCLRQLKERDRPAADPEREAAAFEAVRDTMYAVDEQVALCARTTVLDGLTSFRQRYDRVPRFETAIVVGRLEDTEVTPTGPARIRDAYEAIQLTEDGAFLKAARSALGQSGYQSLRRFCERLYGTPPWEQRDDEDFRRKVLRAYEALRFAGEL
jgi:hypothetical protein